MNASPIARVLLPVALVALIAGCGGAPHRSTPEGSGETGASAPRPEMAAPARVTVPPGQDFGAGVTLDEVTDYADVLANPDRYAGKKLLVRADVKDVCKAKGCWIKVTDGSNEARVRFLDYAFFLPKDCEGKVAWIEGELTDRTVSVEELRHYAAESGTEDPNTITEPLRLVGFMASGVRLSDPQ